MDILGIEAHERFLKKIRLGLEDKRRSATLYHATENIRELTEKGYSAMQHSEDLLRRVRQIKREAIARLDQNLERFIQAAKRNGVTVHLAPNAETAVRQVLELAHQGRAKLIVKAKSMTGEEIDIRHHLERDGFNVVETDLGERIVQLADQRASHVVLSRYPHEREGDCGALLKAPWKGDCAGT